MKKVIEHLISASVFAHVEKHEKIYTGASGAQLYVIAADGKEYVLKTAAPGGRHMEEYKKEYAFYELNHTLRLPFAPEVVYMENHARHGIILVMKRYRPIAHSEWGRELQFRAVDLCAEFNSVPADKLASIARFSPAAIDPIFTEKPYREWKTVLGQHRGEFDDSILDEIYKYIGLACPVLNGEPHYACHGDFHPENILMDGNRLVICDWQNVNIGKSIGDITFFISRGLGFGININADDLLDYYCGRLSQRKGIPIEKAALLKERYAATLLNVFSFWAYHLKNCSVERVAAQFDEMAKAYHYLVHN